MLTKDQLNRISRLLGNAYVRTDDPMEAVHIEECKYIIHNQYMRLLYDDR